MAKKHDIDISISHDGEVQIHVQGIDGAKCLEITKELEEELGIVMAKEKTSDFYKQESGVDTHINTTD